MVIGKRTSTTRTRNAGSYRRGTRLASLGWRPGRNGKVAVLLCLFAATAAGVFSSANQPAQTFGSCVMKGNISASGERIYHLPTDRYYEETIINEDRGERWFCTESEARAAGWRRAKV